MYIITTTASPDQNLTDSIRPLAKDGRTFVAAIPVTADAPEELYELARVVTAGGSGRGDLIMAALRFIGTEAGPDDTVVTLDPDCRAGAAAAEAFLSECESEGGLGVGCFSGDKKKRPGRLTRWFLKLTTGISLTDPFSGVRAFKASLIPELLSLGGSGFEFEARCLTFAAKNRIPVREVSLPGASPAPPEGFRPLRASLPIFRVLIAFILSSLSSFAIDYAAFLLSLIHI